MFKGNIETLTNRNKNYRKVVHTDKYSQLVLMALMPGEDIPKETHEGSQFIRVESGRGIIIRGKERILLKDGIAVEIPPGVSHYVKQTGDDTLHLYAKYSPPEHPSRLVQKRQPRSEK